jgi:hypothetical protein
LVAEDGNGTNRKGVKRPKGRTINDDWNLAFLGEEEGMGQKDATGNLN